MHVSAGAKHNVINEEIKQKITELIFSLKNNISMSDMDMDSISMGTSKDIFLEDDTKCEPDPKKINKPCFWFVNDKIAIECGNMSCACEAQYHRFCSSNGGRLQIGDQEPKIEPLNERKMPSCQEAVNLENYRKINLNENVIKSLKSFFS